MDSELLITTNGFQGTWFDPVQAFDRWQIDPPADGTDSRTDPLCPGNAIAIEKDLDQRGRARI